MMHAHWLCQNIFEKIKFLKPECNLQNVRSTLLPMCVYNSMCKCGETVAHSTFSPNTQVLPEESQKEHMACL